MRFALIEKFLRRCGDAADVPALTQVETGERWTWGQLNGMSASVAHWVSTVGPLGSAVMIRAGNDPRFIAAFLGALRAGRRAFPISPQVSESELHDAAAGSNAIAIISEAPSSVLDLPTLPLEKINEIDAAGDVDSDPTSAALLLSSSGTTGKPKIVQRSAKSIDAVTAAMVEAIGFSPDDRVLALAPLYHSYGIEHGLLAPIFAGSGVNLCRGFDLPRVLAELPRTTILPGVPFMFEALSQVEGRPAHSLRRVYSAGGPLPKTVFSAFQGKFSIPIGQVYGATEIGSVTFSDPCSSGFNGESVGKALRGVEIRLDEPTSEIRIRAQSAFDGYLDGSDSRLDEQGFFKTGDIGRFDEHGNLLVTGRIKLLIDIGGLKVNPLEVEELLCQHPAVADCVVVPMTLGPTVTRLKALIAPRAGVVPPPCAEELRKFARARLSPHKVPRIFEIRDSLPRTPAGKIIRHLIDG